MVRCFLVCTHASFALIYEPRLWWKKVGGGEEESGKVSLQPFAVKPEHSTRSHAQILSEWTSPGRQLSGKLVSNQCWKLSPRHVRVFKNMKINQRTFLKKNNCCSLFLLNLSWSLDWRFTVRTELLGRISGLTVRETLEQVGVCQGGSGIWRGCVEMRRLSDGG